MKMLVLTQVYPMPGGKVTAMYVHVRNMYYASQGAEVSVLNFTASEPAVTDGIEILTWKSFEALENKDQFDLLVLHAANIKNHYRFLKRFGSHFKRYVFVFHGHEVLRMRTIYPPLFSWKKQNNPLAIWARDAYDSIKLKIWHDFFKNAANLQKSDLIFVSKWMKDEFINNTHLDAGLIESRSHIIYNSVGKMFEEHIYQPENVEYDFVTIRMNIDGEKYCVDVVNSLAKANPQYRFLVVGRGELFSHIEKADNLVWEDRNLHHTEMFDVLNRCRFALMPTKTDAQGLMMCEMATFGVPLVTSDIPVCHEVLDDFENVAFISNTGEDNLAPITEKLKKYQCTPKERQRKFFEENTSGKEYKLLTQITERKTQ